MAHLKSDEYGVGDAVLLDEITEDAFVANLKRRFSKDKIYTYIGEVLVSVNPYADLGLYKPELVETFRNRALYQNEPHIFALSEATYSTMRRTHQDCVVIISGESGAGKTEASKRVMEYIAAVNTSKGRAEIERVKEHLLASTPILEAFGNAKTNVNDNSSRFGKYMDIMFDFKAEPIGGHIKNYLLEKSRVVKHAAGERNFHFFYQLLTGAPDAVLSSLSLERNPSSYAYTNQVWLLCFSVCDKAGFDEVTTAMRTIGFDDAFIECVHKLVAAALHLGQVAFTPNGALCVCVSVSVSVSVCLSVCTTKDALLKALTTRVVAARGEVIETPLTAEKASKARHALAKSIYGRLFSHIVKNINTCIGVKADKHTALGVLDIYGFEIFPSNGFDQFCINYCNEKLQQVFIELVLKLEQDEYAREGIDWVNIEYFNNHEICVMIDDPKAGMIAVLDEQCAIAGGTDAAFLANLDRSFKSHARYSSFQTDSSDTSCERSRDFRIRHFAGDVVYTVDGFVEKNNDTLFHDLKRMLYNCDNAALKDMWPEGADPLTAVHKMPPTAATNFRTSMDELVVALKQKCPFYIRCIRPNRHKAAKKWEDDLCVHQVRYLGLMENLRVRRAGYCNRQPYEVFLERYKMCCKATWPHWHREPKDGVRKIIEELNLKDEVAFGNTQLFIKNPSTLQQLEDIRDAKIPLVVARIQAAWRGLLARRHYVKLRAVYRIMSFWYRCRARRYLADVLKRFENVKDSPDLGKGVEWPSTPTGLGQVGTLLRKVHLCWRAKRILARFTPEQTEELKQKIHAQDLIKGRRRFWGFQYKWEGNYIAKSADAQKFGAQMQPLMAKYGDKKIFFSSRVSKLNTKGKEDPRVVVVTDRHIYRLDSKTFKIHKQPVPLDEVEGFGMSSGEDQACIVRLKGDTDLVLTLRGDACSAELVSLITQAKGEDVPVDVGSKLKYKVKGQLRSLGFEEGDTSKTGFARKSSGYALVTRKESMMRLKAGRKPSTTSASLGGIKE
ncbi:myosin IB [Salpingoeca rosetta]|uniref:Myosin IB n=1 Tax=Salpingoeca rosetta (strain ATCC 50818 / BSB-021) TaxID=946362 RepID=F2UJZ9_SALR5|nr:myosin IB [Salpingoeca rosetta]EGD77448.1 myosin IB [Salpingoeca rosetta]|eukprot:XP_004990336.1 myosin IB [Salpingoeca rosetta]